MWEKNNDKNLIITDMILGGIIESEDAKFLKNNLTEVCGNTILYKYICYLSEIQNLKEINQKKFQKFCTLKLAE